MPVEHAGLSNKTALVEVSFGNHYHFRNVGIIRIRNADDDLELVMAAGCKVPGKELTVFPVTAEQTKHFLPCTTGEYDLVFEGVFCPTGLSHEARS